MKSRRGRLGVNFACYIGHSNVRRWVMGEAATERAATPEEIDAMSVMIAEAMAAGARWASRLPQRLPIIAGRPVPSRLATHDKVLEMAAEIGTFGTGSICFLPASAVSAMTQDDYEYLLEIGAASGVPVIIQGMRDRPPARAIRAS